MGLIGKIFYNTGKASATRPWTSIFIGLVICAIGSIGFVNFRSTVSTLNLFGFLAPRGSQRFENWSYVTYLFTY